MRQHWKGWFIAGAGLAAGLAIGISANVAAQSDYQAATNGTRILQKGDIRIRMLVEEANLGGTELDIGEILLPTSYGQGGGHHHGRVEIFFVLEGRLGHTVNGQKHILEPGMVGIVRPEDEVAHSIESSSPVKALVIWAPGGEAERLTKEFGYTARPIN